MDPDASLGGLVSNELVIFGGELDLAAEEQARQALERGEQGSPAVLAVDLRQLTFMDATGLKLLVGASQRAQAENRRLVVIVADGPVRRLLRLSGVEERIELSEKLPSIFTRAVDTGALYPDPLGPGAPDAELAEWAAAEMWLNEISASVNDGQADKEPRLEPHPGIPVETPDPTDPAETTRGYTAEPASGHPEKPGSNGEAGPGEFGKDGKDGKRDGGPDMRVSGDREARLGRDLEPDSGPYWVLIRERASDHIRDRVPEIFVLTSGRKRPVLPVFSSGEAAHALLGSPATPGEEAGWRVREAGAGELISVLSASDISAGPCAGVEKVALDPPAEILDQPELLALLTVHRRYFLESLLGRRSVRFQTPG